LNVKGVEAPCGDHGVLERSSGPEVGHGGGPPENVGRKIRNRARGTNKRVIELTITGGIYVEDQFRLSRGNETLNRSR